MTNILKYGKGAGMTIWRMTQCGVVVLVMSLMIGCDWRMTQSGVVVLVMSLMIGCDWRMDV